MIKVNSYNIRGWLMFSFTAMCCLFILQIFSCHSKKSKLTPQIEKSIFVEEHKEKLENFVFLVKESHAACVSDEEQSCPDSMPVMPLASASGVVLSSSSSHIFILTANHFCESSDFEKMIGQIKIRAFIGETTRTTNIVSYSKEADIWLLQGLKFKNENFKTTRIAGEMPLIGEKVFNVAAPDGMASPNTRLMFNGNFSGCEELNCVFSVPATFGSSGSAIYNKKGELISILVAATTNFENISMGPHVAMLQTLIETVDKEVNIY